MYRSTYRILDKGGEGKVVKEVCKAFPDVCVAVFPQAFIVESINLRDLPALVVPSENGHSVLVSDLHRYQQSDGLYAIVSTIYIVAHEEIVCIGGIAANAKQLREIVLFGCGNARIIRQAGDSVAGRRESWTSVTVHVLPT